MSRLAPAALVLSLLGTQACGLVEIDESCGPTQDLFKTVDLSSVGAAKSNLDYQMEFANGRRYFRWSSDLVEACSAEHVAVEFRMRQKPGHLPAGVQAVGRIFHYLMQPYEAVFDFTRTPDQNVFSARTTGGLEDVNWAAAQQVPTFFVEIEVSIPGTGAGENFDLQTVLDGFDSIVMDGTYNEYKQPDTSLLLEPRRTRMGAPRLGR